MISRTTEELEQLMSKLANYINSGKSIQVSLSKDSISHLHDVILLSKAMREKATTLPLAQNIDKEMASLREGYISESESVLYNLVDELLQNKEVVND